MTHSSMPPRLQSSPSYRHRQPLCSLLALSLGLTLLPACLASANPTQAPVPGHKIPRSNRLVQSLPSQTAPISEQDAPDSLERGGANQAGAQAPIVPATPPITPILPPPGTTSTPDTPQPTLTPSLPAQTPALRQPSYPQGQKILLNGQSLSGAWQQWSVNGNLRTGLSDAALVQLLGVDLLSTDQLDQQPIQWFSEGAIATLPAQFQSPFRYLDITDLAQSQGWQLQANGNTLQIFTQPAKVTAFEQQEQPWGDQITLTLDRATAWRVDPQKDELILTLDAQINPEFAQAFQPKPAKQLKSLSIQAAPNQTTLRLGIPLKLRPQIVTLANPDRLMINIGSHYLADKDIRWARGVRWRQQYLTLGNTQFPVVWLELNPRQAGLSLRPILSKPGTINGITSVFQTAQTRQAISGNLSQPIAVINGGFFNRKEKLPLGAVRFKNQWLSGPILNRGVVGWSRLDDLRFDRLTLQETLTTASGEQFPLTTLNSGYLKAGIARYTAAWGSTYTTLSNGETLLTVQNNQVMEQQSAPTPGQTVPIPVNGYLLVLRSSPQLLASLPQGTALQLGSTLTPDLSRYANIMGAGPLLVQNNQIVLDPRGEGFSDKFIQEMAARSAIGQTQAGTLLVVTIHHRPGGPGPTLADTAEIMRQLGAVNALNLDGGSSTTLYLGGQILDRPPRSAARVNNGLGIFLQP